MPIIKEIERYVPSSIPYQASPQLRKWLEDEFERIAHAINGSLEVSDALRSIPKMYLFGNTDNFNLDAVDSKILNYEFTYSNTDPSFSNPVSGDIIIPESGIYSGTGFIYGVQSEQDRDEEIHLLVDVNNTERHPIATMDVATKKTDDRVFNGSLTGNFLIGDVVSLWMNATDDLGIFNTTRASFELVKIN